MEKRKNKKETPNVFIVLFAVVKMENCSFPTTDQIYCVNGGK